MINEMINAFQHYNGKPMKKVYFNSAKKNSLRFYFSPTLGIPFWSKVHTFLFLKFLFYLSIYFNSQGAYI